MSESMPEIPDGPLENQDMPDRTQNDAPDVPGVWHRSEGEPDDR